MKATVRGMLGLMVMLAGVGCDDSTTGDSTASGGTMDVTTGGDTVTGGVTTGGVTMEEADAAMPTQCDTICAVSGSIACQRDKVETCVAECMSLIDLAQACPTETQAYFDCLEATSMVDWECDGAGQAEPKAGVCETEGLALNGCAQAMQAP